jgi:hypothetical protein
MRVIVGCLRKTVIHVDEKICKRSSGTEGDQLPAYSYSNEQLLVYICNVLLTEKGSFLNQIYQYSLVTAF